MIDSEKYHNIYRDEETERKRKKKEISSYWERIQQEKETI